MGGGTRSGGGGGGGGGGCIPASDTLEVDALSLSHPDGQSIPTYVYFCVGHTPRNTLMYNTRPSDLGVF